MRCWLASADLLDRVVFSLEIREIAPHELMGSSEDTVLSLQDLSQRQGLQPKYCWHTLHQILLPHVYIKSMLLCSSECDVTICHCKAFKRCTTA